jgi:hypothetical protein
MNSGFGNYINKNKALQVFSTGSTELGTALALCWVAKARRWSNGVPKIGD